MKTSQRVALLGSALLFAAPARAHDGPRIWIDKLDGRIVTLASNNDLNPTVYTPSRLFATTLTDYGGIFTGDFPGYEVIRSGAHVSAGTTFGFNIAAPLLVYDTVSSSFITTAAKYGPPQPGPVPQMAVSLSSTIRFTGSGPVSGFNFLTYTGPGAHAHLSYTQTANGAAYNGPAGVYLLPMNLTSSTITGSLTYYLLIGKQVAQGTAPFNQAWNAADTMLRFPGDANLDQRVDAVDLGLLAQHWTGPGQWIDGDFNLDGTVNILDLRIMADHWLDGTGALGEALASFGLPASSVPEPAWPLTVLGLGLWAMNRRRPTLKG